MRLRKEMSSSSTRVVFPRPSGVWGELATNSAIQQGVAGVIISGAARDTGDIRELDFPLFTSHVSPTAGEPKGFGEINVPIRISGVRIGPGDWVLADDDGVCVIPKEKAVEYTNRAMDGPERGNPLREEIRQGRTLSKVPNLLRWGKKYRPTCRYQSTWSPR